MQSQSDPSHTYQYRFWKDHYWVWILCLPIGLVSWVLPVLLFFGLRASNMPLGVVLFVVAIIGIPSYIAGCAFFTGIMQGLFTRVTIHEQMITFRKPWFPFPFCMVTTRILISNISQLKMSLGFNAGNITVFFHTNKSKKIRQIPLPQFKDIEYLREIVATKTRIEPPVLPVVPAIENTAQNSPVDAQKDQPGTKKPSFRMRPFFIEKILDFFIGWGMLVLAVISGWITTSLPGKKFETFAVGLSLGSFCFFLALCGIYPGIGQVVFWFLGRPVIHAIFWLCQIKGDEILWDTPPVVNQLLKQLRIDPIHSNLTEFIFWMVLIISICISLHTIIAWFKRRAHKKFIKDMNTKNTPSDPG